MAGRERELRRYNYLTLGLKIVVKIVAYVEETSHSKSQCNRTYVSK
jgi:hypothetical protein